MQSLHRKQILSSVEEVDELTGRLARGELDRANRPGRREAGAFLRAPPRIVRASRPAGSEEERWEKGAAPLPPPPLSGNVGLFYLTARMGRPCRGDFVFRARSAD
ncbi:hypothetical protein SKAU_G00142890 [Synaphobranchus kaupii]|uniref:Uncharacterized protein n=1 Tax=Synaphobranchus kaupii TaxID=118154 RepID=A0A9Q1FST6_SYNKA|nr:hypothetical protein SKAU_G00142890 [Synaphobranchus kaupii]